MQHLGYQSMKEKDDCSCFSIAGTNRGEDAGFRRRERTGRCVKEQWPGEVRAEVGTTTKTEPESRWKADLVSSDGGQRRLRRKKLGG